MKEYGKLLMLCLLIMTTLRGHLLADDSIPATELKEVEVLGERAWIDSDGTMNFIPTKKEKRLSNSAASLIGSMHIPFLKEKEGAIENISGEPVAVFINGQIAETIDLSTFWPGDVLKVQYMDNPKDPVYGGARNVVNFIMKQYATGGVSKTTLTQKIPNYGYYTTSAKLVYKKMTFGAFLQGIYSRDHRSSTMGETKYRNIHYNGILYDEITSAEDSRVYERRDIINSAINARYATDGFLAIHTISLGWMRSPGSGSESTETWTDNLFGSDRSTAHSSSRRLTPQVSGSYYRRFSDKWHLSWRWGYAHAGNDSKSGSTTGEMDEVVNESDERIDRVQLTLAPSFLLSSKWYFQMYINSGRSWYSTLYSGSANERHRQTRNETSANVTAGWSPLPSLRFVAQPGLLYSRWHIGDIHEHTFKPTVNAWASWTPSGKFNVSGNINFQSVSPDASQSNPVLVRNSELMWSQGNPQLKNTDALTTSVHASYMPLDDLSTAFRMYHCRTNNEIVTYYEAAGPETGGIIRHTRNAPPSDNFSVGIPVSWSCLDGNLSLEFYPEWEYTCVHGDEKKSFDCFHFTAEADYTLGNCRFEVSYGSPYQGFYSAGMERTRKQDSCSVAFVYGNDNLYLKAELENVFHSKARDWTRISTGAFLSEINRYETGRRFALTLTYTFCFGRKVDRSIDISGPELVPSSVGSSK